MTELEALVALNMIGGIGSVKLFSLLEHFSKPQDVFNASCDQLQRIAGIPLQIAQQIHSFPYPELEKEFRLAQKLRLTIASYRDEHYPGHLTNIPGFPIVLYIQGSITAQDSVAIAIVGSRRASLYGLMNAQKFSSDLCAQGLTVISGMARGIDTYAHRGALKSGGRTIAVLGSGLGHIYPKENIDLAQEISKAGAVISEFPLTMPPLKQNFPRRNRIISGLSLGVVVVEAARNSGALITADFALEQGKEVFALPGKVDSQTSFGTNCLIQQGAKLVCCVDDIMEELNLCMPSSHRTVIKDEPGQDCAQAVPVQSPSDSGSVLYSLIPDNQPMAIDEIAEKSSLSIPVLSDILLRLEMQKLITQLPGKQYVRKRT